MSRRNQRSQSKHDRKVKSLAENLESQGFKVEADLNGYDQPKTLGGVRPDIIAKKGSERRIYEVETPDSLDTTRDLEQQKEFKKAADRSDNTTFRRFTAQ